MCSAEKCVERWRIGEKGKEVSIYVKKLLYQWLCTGQMRGV